MCGHSWILLYGFGSLEGNLKKLMDKWAYCNPAFPWTAWNALAFAASCEWWNRRSVESFYLGGMQLLGVTQIQVWHFWVINPTARQMCSTMESENVIYVMNYSNYELLVFCKYLFKAEKTRIWSNVGWSCKSSGFWSIWKMPRFNDSENEINRENCKEFGPKL